MKKFLILVCMIACVFGMTACGGEKRLTEYEQRKVDSAKNIAENVCIPYIQQVLQERGRDYYNDYTAEEIHYIVGNELGLDVDGYAFKSALESFEKANEEIGGPGRVTGSEAEIDDDRIIVTVFVQGSKADASAEVVLSNDMFFRLESASLNKVSTMGDSMSKAAMNTLLGMGSVFIVLILISLIISCFSFIPKIQAAFAKKEEVQVASTVGIDNALAQIEQLEENDSTDDLELVAVIAAAIAASEGAASTDGFVVRSIKRRRAF